MAVEKWAILAISRGIISKIASNSHVDKLNTKNEQGPETTIKLDNNQYRIKNVELYSCTHILESVPSPPQGPTGPKDNNQTW